MTKNEGYLGNMVNDMNAGRDLLVWAADGSNTPDDLNSMVTSLASLRDSLLYSANSIDQEGRYVFSGTQTDVAAMGFDPAAGLGARYTYPGNLNRQEVVVGNGVTQDRERQRIRPGNLPEPTRPSAKSAHSTTRWRRPS
jgi:flagellar hook-associated protein 3 FlgL